MKTGFLAVAMIGCIAIGMHGVLVGGEAKNKEKDSKKEETKKSGTIKGKITAKRVRSPENVLVYIEKVSGEQAPPEKLAEMDQKKLSFVPLVLPIVKGTTVRFLNSDPVLHNIFWRKNKDGSYASRNLGTWGKGGVRKYTFKEEGHLVLLCNVHPEMEAHVVVLQNPYFAVVGKEGTYEIKGVPPGDYTVKTWYPKPKRLKSKSSKVTVKADQTTDLDFSLSRR